MRLDERYNKYYPDLNNSDKLIWHYLSTHRKECSELSINELAERCHVSRTTILRFSKKLRYKGYSELKVTLAQEEKQESATASGIPRVVGAYNDEIRRISKQDCARLFELFDRSRNLYVYSTGRIQSSAAHELTRIFLQAGLLFYEVRGEAESRSILKMLTPEDCMVMISCSGESNEAISFARALNVRGVPVVSITLLRDNQMAKLTDFRLYASSTDISSAVLGTDYQSLSGFFILIEMLFLKYIAYKEDKGGQS